MKYLPLTLLRKRSEPSFGEQLLSNGSGLINLVASFYYSKNRSFDKISMSPTFIKLYIKGKLISSTTYEGMLSISYDSVRECLDITTETENNSLSLKAFKITYDEVKEIREKLGVFNEHLS